MIKSINKKMTGFSDPFKNRVRNETDKSRNVSIRDMIEQRVHECPEGILGGDMEPVP